MTHEMRPLLWHRHSVHTMVHTGLRVRGRGAFVACFSVHLLSAEKAVPYCRRHSYLHLPNYKSRCVNWRYGNISSTISLNTAC